MKSKPTITASGPFFWLSTTANRSFNPDCEGEAGDLTDIGGNPRSTSLCRQTDCGTWGRLPTSIPACFGLVPEPDPGPSSQMWRSGSSQAFSLVARTGRRSGRFE